MIFFYKAYIENYIFRSTVVDKFENMSSSQQHFSVKDYESILPNRFRTELTQTELKQECLCQFCSFYVAKCNLQIKYNRTYKKESKLTWISCLSCEDCASQVLSNKKHIVTENDYYDLLSKLKDPTFMTEKEIKEIEDMNRLDYEDEYDYSYDEEEDDESYEEEYYR